MRTILVLLLAGVLAASAAAAPDGNGFGSPQKSVWESMRDELVTAIECEREARKLAKLGKIRKEIRQCAKHLARATKLIDDLGVLVTLAEDSRLGEVRDAIREARAKDAGVTGETPRTEFPGDVEQVTTRQEARRLIKEALVAKLRALGALEVELGYTVDVSDSLDDIYEDDYVIRRSGMGQRRLAGAGTVEVNELWFTSPAPIAATSGVAVAEPTGAFRFVSGEALSPRVYRFVLAQPLLQTETLLVAFKGIPAGTLVVLDLVSHDDGVQRLAVRTP
jgi:hypothetical protein